MRFPGPPRRFGASGAGVGSGPEVRVLRQNLCFLGIQLSQPLQRQQARGRAEVSGDPHEDGFHRKRPASVPRREAAS